MKTVVISSCTGKKYCKPENMLTIEDFKDSGILKTKTTALEAYKSKASKIYTGPQHLLLMEGLKELREKYGDGIIDLYIVSAGYGLLSENDLIVPYEVTFSTMNSKEINNWGRKLNIKEDLQRLIANYDLAIFILGDKYLKAVGLPLEEIPKDTKLIFITSKTASKNIPTAEHYFTLEYGKNEARSFSYGLVGLKGYLMKLLCYEIANNGKKILNKHI